MKDRFVLFLVHKTVPRELVPYQNYPPHPSSATEVSEPHQICISYVTMFTIEQQKLIIKLIEKLPLKTEPRYKS